MNILKRILVLAITVSGSSAFAGYSQIAVCGGSTDKGLNASVTLFANQAADTTGIVVATLTDGQMKISDTKIDWNANPQGFPRFFDNDFDLDIVISETAVTSDDVLVGDNYVGKLDCSYQPIIAP